MANKRKRRSDPLGTPVNMAKSVLDRSANIAGEIADSIANVTRPIRSMAAPLVGSVSPTAANHRAGTKTDPKHHARQRRICRTTTSRAAPERWHKDIVSRRPKPPQDFASAKA